MLYFELQHCNNCNSDMSFPVIFVPLHDERYTRHCLCYI